MYPSYFCHGVSHPAPNSKATTIISFLWFLPKIFYTHNSINIYIIFYTKVYCFCYLIYQHIRNIQILFNGYTIVQEYGCSYTHCKYVLYLFNYPILMGISVVSSLLLLHTIYCYEHTCVSPTCEYILQYKFTVKLFSMEAFINLYTYQ